MITVLLNKITPQVWNKLEVLKCSSPPSFSFLCLPGARTSWNEEDLGSLWGKRQGRKPHWKCYIRTWGSFWLCHTAHQHLCVPSCFLALIPLLGPSLGFLSRGHSGASLACAPSTLFAEHLFLPLQKLQSLPEKQTLWYKLTWSKQWPVLKLYSFLGNWE